MIEYGIQDECDDSMTERPRSVVYLQTNCGKGWVVPLMGPTTYYLLLTTYYLLLTTYYLLLTTYYLLLTTCYLLLTTYYLHNVPLFQPSKRVTRCTRLRHRWAPRQRSLSGHAPIGTRAATIYVHDTAPERAISARYTSESLSMRSNNYKSFRDWFQLSLLQRRVS